MITLLAFVGAIVMLVLFHEYGHYLLARRFGVKVLVFSLGFGKILYRKRFAHSDTEWVISAVPLGGYVRMLDEREGEVLPEELGMAFNRKPVLQRIAIVAAGPVANLVLAVFLYWVLFMHGQPGLKPMLGDVPAGTPAAIAQMHKGETITAIDGVSIPSWQELHWKLLTLAIKRGDVRIDALAPNGAHVEHVLSLASLDAHDLEGDFLDKLGLNLYQPTVLPVIGLLTPDGVAKQAGLREGDEVLRADGAVMSDWPALVEVVRSHPGRALQLDIRRGQSRLALTVVPQTVVESGKTVGKIGAAPKVDEAAWQAMKVETRYGPVEALSRSLAKTWDTSVISLKMMGKMIQGEVSVKNLSGPITIADYAGQSAHLGLAAYLSFLALISISLGVLNLLPVPILDGGHLLYYVGELLKGSPVSEQAWEIGQKIGIALLGTMMVFAIYNDINRLISG